MAFKQNVLTYWVVKRITSLFGSFLIDKRTDIAVNDLIDKYVNKTCMNISGEFKLAGKELV